MQGSPTDPRIAQAIAYGHLRGTLAYGRDCPVSDPAAREYYDLEDRIENPTSEEREAFRAAYRSAIEAAEQDCAEEFQSVQRTMP